MKANKFIIVAGKLYVGRVELHLNLIPKGFNMRDPIGGGRFEFGNEVLASKGIDSNAVLLYGSSSDFGNCTAEEIKNALDKQIPYQFIDKNIYFSKHEYFSDALQDHEFVRAAELQTA